MILHELERRGTLAAVARALSFSPSAVSQQLAQLEREVGTPLTEPVGRGVRLTEAARVLVVHARAAIAELEEAESEVAALQGLVAGRLHVASFQTGLLSLLPATLESLARDYPELRIDVSQREADESTSGLLAGVFDVVTGEEYPGHSIPANDRMHRDDLGPDDLFLAVGRSGPWSDAAELADLAEAPWALDPEDSDPGRWARALCRGAGFEPDVRFDGIDLLMHVHMVQSGQAVSLLPALLGQDRTRGVRLVPLAGQPRRQIFTLVRAARATHPAVLAFRTALANVFQSSERPRFV